MNAKSNEDVQRWFDGSRYDLDTAQAMLRAERYLYVLFCCQQATEKHLKGLIVARQDQMPPKIHDLLRLSELAGMANNPDQQRLLGNLNGYYIETRYPEEVSSLAEQLSRETAEQCLTGVREYLDWLGQMQK